MAIRRENAGQGDRHSFSLPITQADLADATGLTSVHVNRVLKVLRGRGVVTAERGTITVHDWDELVSIGELDDAFMVLDGPSPRMSEAA